VEGYHLYRRSEFDPTFKRINASLVKEASFIDPFPPSTKTIYQVRAVKLEASAGGTYYNSSQGIFGKPDFSSIVVSEEADLPGEAASANSAPVRNLPPTGPSSLLR
jgi:hypothetical protein